MECNRGTKRKETDKIENGANPCDEQPYKKRMNYEPPDRAKRSEGQPKSSWRPRLNDVALPQSQYQYAPIDAESIRLLYIQPDAGNGDIHCALETAKLSDNPKYEALSYTWGSEPAIHAIFVDNDSFYVKPNLHSALRQFRSETQEVCLWIDAICIDQSNNEERGVQVGKMASIYQSAVRTLVWLGGEDASSQHALSFISQIATPDFLNQDKWTDDYGILAMAGLLKRSWFSRLWTIQEAAVAREVVFVCGTLTFKFSDLSDAVDIVRDRLADVRDSFKRSPYYAEYEGLLDDLEGSRSVRLLDTLKDVFLRSQDGRIIRPRRGLEAMLYELRDYQSTDPRDRVYALLRMLNRDPLNQTPGLPSLTPDYNRTNLEVHTDAVMYCTRLSGSLDIIVRRWADVKRRPWQDDMVDPDLRFVVPSWISTLGDMPFGHPKLESRVRVNADPLVGGPSQQIYCAHNGKIAKIRFGVDDAKLTYTGSLFVKGVKLGEIEQLSTRMPDGILLRECLEMIGGIIRDDAGGIQGINDSLWRIFCANRDEKGLRAPALYRISLLQLLRHSTCPMSIDTTDLLHSTQPRHIEAFLRRVQSVIWNRRVFQSQGRTELESGLIGLVPREAQEGDQVCILYGCSVPVLLRPHRQSTANVSWELVGEAYIDGVMEGQAISSISDNVLVSMEEEFEIR